MTGEKEYLDEIIIRRRRELEKSRHSCIQSGIYAGEELITFSETELFDGTVKVFLPETFTDMPDEITQFTKNNILMQASQSMLAQANAVPQSVLSLLQ